MSKNRCVGGGGGAVYGLGLIGAAVFYLQHAANFSDVIIGLVKSVLWPALVTYRVVEFLKV